jgi:peptide/nickel transport system substrate-binding protein
MSPRRAIPAGGKKKIPPEKQDRNRPFQIEKRLLGRMFLFLCLLRVAFTTFPAMAGETAETRFGDAKALFVFARGGDSIDLDPLTMGDAESAKVCLQVCEPLVRIVFTPAGQVLPQLTPWLASSWDVAPDGRTWTFFLRKDVLFHDTTPFDAEAVLFNLKRWVDSGLWHYDFEKMEALDTCTVRLRLSTPVAPFLFLSSLPLMVSPEAVRKRGEAFLREHPVGTGPFRFTEWRRREYILLERFNDYWGDKARMDGVLFRLIESPLERLTALRSGDIDAFDGVTPEVLQRMTPTDREHLRLFSQPGMNVGFLTMDTQRKPFDDPRVRRAVAMAIDKKRLVAEVFRGLGIPAENMVPPNSFAFAPELRALPHDPTRARALLVQAGLENGFDTELNVLPIPRPYMPDGDGAAIRIQEDLGRVGIRVTLVRKNWEDYLDDAYNHRYPLLLDGWIGTTGDPDDFLYPLFRSDSVDNLSRYGNDDYDRFVISARRSWDPEERFISYFRAQQLLRNEVPAVPLAHGYNLALTRKNVEGFRLYATGEYRFSEISLTIPSKAKAHREFSAPPDLSGTTATLPKEEKDE